MCVYAVTKADPPACAVRNARGQRPMDVAAAGGRGEVLNAMLLGCSGEAGGAAVSGGLYMVTWRGLL
jgi:hypothetical protein